MKCIVTAGPTYEPLDEVRRLTNFSSGKLGSLLAAFLTERGHDVILLLGHYSTFKGEPKAHAVQTFTTTEDLQLRLKSFSDANMGAVFHAAAVSDFKFGKTFERLPNGELAEIKAGKISTRASNALLAELVPTTKIISHLREWYPNAGIVGWKYEVDGDRPVVIDKAQRQIKDNNTTACVANGPAYGFGFGLVTPKEQLHFSDTNELFAGLEKVVQR